MRGKLIKVRAKININSLSHIFVENDILYIQSILLDKPKLIHNPIGGLINEDGKIVRIFGTEYVKELKGKKKGEEVVLSNGNTLRVLSDAVYAPIGSYDRVVIINDSGREYSGSCLGVFTLDTVFEKI